MMKYRFKCLQLMSNKSMETVKITLIKIFITSVSSKCKLINCRNYIVYVYIRIEM